MDKLNTTNIVNTLRDIVIDSKNRAVQNVNSILTLMYWEIGNTINQEILKDLRAKYGKEIVVTVSRQLVQEFGKGFEKKVSTPSRQLAEYLTVLPPKRQLEAKLHEALRLAKERYHVED